MRLFLLSLLLLSCSLRAVLVPMPREIALGEGELRVDVQTTVIAADEHAVLALTITTALQKTTGFAHRTISPQRLKRMKMPRAVRLEIGEQAPSAREESYRLKITPEGATITGSDRAGLMHGVQTFVQLLPVAKDPFPRVMIPSQTITDWPETQRRIFKLDVSQHLFPTADLKALIDWLSFHKLNEFHLKLNGDAGWRMESLKFPRLHEVGSVRASTPPLADPRGSDSIEYGGYYPQEKLRELAEYARARGIDLVPCFSIVTGASALIAAYPELGAAPVEVAATWEAREIGVVRSAETLAFFEQFFAELATVFPSDYVRLEGAGGEFHAALGMLLAQHDKTLFPAGKMAVTDFAVYASPAEAELLASPKRRSEDGLNTLRDVYELEVGQIAEATLRTRYVPRLDKLQYLVFPRLAAFAEATWLPAERRKYDDLLTRTRKLIPRYRLLGVQAPMPYDVPSGETIGGAVITTSMQARKGNGAELAFDGRNDSFFWSEGELKKGDHLTLEFPWSIAGDLTVATGRIGGAGALAPGHLIDGVLDLSADGEEWDAVAEFFDGLASVTVPPGTRYARIRVFSPQDDPLVLHEVVLSEPLLLPKFSEKRRVKLPLSEEEITLTFQANFTNHPGLRDEIEVLRRTFFANWLPLAVRLGLAHHPKTSRSFVLQEAEPGELSAKEAEDWMKKRLLTKLQSYGTSTPPWFESGMMALLLGDVPAKPNRSKALEGGAETAAFLQTIEKNHGEQVLMSISQDCRAARYDQESWKLFTGKSLVDLVNHYQSKN